MRMIDADALDARIYNEIPIKVFGNVAKMAKMREIVAEAPTIDAEPIVKCTDCWKRGHDNCPMEFYFDCHPEDDECYCKYGERKMNHAAD